MLLNDFAQQRIDGRNRIDLIAPKLDAISLILITRINFNHIAAHAEAAAFEVDVVALVLQFDQPLQQCIARDLHSRLQKNQHAVVGIRIAKPINARDTRHYDDIATLKQGARRGHAQSIDFFINDRVLFDVCVRGGNVSFRLIIIVVRNEVFDRVLGKQRFKFLIKLRAQGLIVGDYQRRALGPFDHAGDGKGLAAAGDAEQNLIP